MNAHADVSTRLRALGLEPARTTLTVEANDARDEAALGCARALKRAAHLERRAARKPLASNGRRVDEQRARELRTTAGQQAAEHGLDLSAIT